MVIFQATIFFFKHRNLTSLYFSTAVKCNDDPIVIKTLAGLGAGFDCASMGEIAKVMSFGVHSEAIIFANPTKPAVDLKFASKMNVDLMTVDGSFELQKIAEFYPTAK